MTDSTDDQITTEARCASRTGEPNLMKLTEQPIAEKHRIIATAFGERVAAVTDWEAPTPVQEWRARDVVGHLMWIRSLLDAAVDLGQVPSAADDPVGAWIEHCRQIQQLLDDPATMDIIHTGEHTGTSPVPVLIDRIYTGDVFFHTWDLARSNGLDDTLDSDFVHEALIGMTAAEEFLRPTGQFGVRQPVADDASEQDQLFAFLGRDPHWQPPPSAD